MYIIEMKKIQRAGPYNLMGWSFGGVLSVEIARQLFKNEDIVANIFLIDSFLNYKYVVDKIGHDHDQKKLLKDINYNYSLPINLDLSKKIVLFKASILDDIDFEKEIYDHYTNNVEDNYLGKFFDKEKIEVIKLLSSHMGWTNIQEDVQLIVKKIIHHMQV